MSIRAFMQRCVLMVAVLTFTGCAMLTALATRHKQNVSARPEFYGGYAPGNQFVTLHDYFLLEVELWGRRTAVTTPKEPFIRGRYDYDTPPSIEEFRRVGSTGEYSEVVGILDRGTVLEVSRFVHHDAVGLKGVVVVFAKILDGPFAGEEVDIVNLSWANAVEDGPLLLKPNQALITEIGGAE